MIGNSAASGLRTTHLSLKPGPRCWRIFGRKSHEKNVRAAIERGTDSMYLKFLISFGKRAAAEVTCTPDPAPR